MRFTALLIAAACGMIDAATTAAPTACEQKWIEIGITLVAGFAGALGNPTAGDVINANVEAIIRGAQQWDALVAGKGIEEVCPTTAAPETTAAATTAAPETTTTAVKPTYAPSVRPTADLNNGIWHIADINYYRKSVTKGDTEKLIALMGMNETNETELMLVTPLSEAPTPMPPTPPPTPVPQDVSVSVAFVVELASTFDMAATLKALGVDTATAKATVVHQIQVTSTISPVPTMDEAKRLYVTIFVGILENTIKVLITENAGSTSAAAGGRRLQTASADVTASGESSNPSVIDAAKTKAADPTQITSNLKVISSAKFQSMPDPTIKSAPGITSRLDITQTETDAASAQSFAEKIQKTIDSPPTALTVASGATGVSGTTAVKQTPTPMPTKMPTNMPTVLPAGFTYSPTKMPTGTPTKMPTGTPTKMPTPMPTKTPTKMPTAMPTNMPTKMPTAMPTKTPTAMPTKAPTKPPTKMPTAMPTPVPPTSAPTMSPTNASIPDEESGTASAGMLTAAAFALGAYVVTQ